MLTFSVLGPWLWEQHTEVEVTSIIKFREEYIQGILYCFDRKFT
jgi:hypothetical protein